ncbi:MAG: HPr family phosphocarrier protein [Chlamydiota bacterium]
MKTATNKLVRSVQVVNALGIHTRPATMIVKMLQNCKSQVSFTLRKEKINPKSIMSILMLAAAKNSRITIEVEGEDAEVVMQNLVAGFESGFGE